MAETEMQVQEGRMHFVQRLIAFVVLLPAFSVFAQAIDHPQGQRPLTPTLAARQKDNLSVVLDVISNKANPTYTAAELTVTDNGKTIAPENLQILAERDAKFKAQLLFIIDTVNSSLADVTRSEEAITAFLRQGDGAFLQPTTVLILSDTAPQSKSSTPSQGNDTTALHKRHLFVHRLSTIADGNALAKELDDYKAGYSRILESQGADAVSERVHLSLEALSFIANAEANMPGAKVTVWLSPGWPFLTRSEAKSSDQLFDSVVYFSDALRAARMILYMINPKGITNQELSEDYYKEFIKGVSTPKQSNANDLSLQVLAIQSGGSVVQQNNDLKSQINKCAADVANLMAISYLPARTGGVTIYHDVQVKTVHPAQNLRARTGFYSR